ncbi:hypothetical protein PG993_011490 [Apiospora rasikravindrae]|uniref:Uncharacterized protein n=1 Tax=Apiospora rasikravindrae TaxID=990691 RepID=A0ABR1SEE5_9PEZI
MDADDNVYLGVWTNWSRGRVLGSTLTLSREHGNYLIALTAFFIAFVATRFWRISCFAFHRWFSSPTSAETIYRQRQIILCNSSSPESGLVSLSVLLWSWRNLGLRRLYGLSLLILFVVICISGFVAAGSFSSRISTDVRNEVLLRADHCGIISPSLYTESNLYNAWFSQQISAAINYAEQCYSSSRISSMVECGRFILPKLPTAVTDYNAGCPFQSDICRSNNSNIMFDSGYLDSREHLGLNSPDGLRFQQREVLHCAPLKTEGYEKAGTVDNQRVVAYDYGGNIRGSSDNITVRKYTHQVVDVDTQYKLNQFSVSGRDFILQPQNSVIYKGKADMRGSFLPRKELLRPDGDTEIIFLSGNGVLFNRKMTDDWYRATVPSYTLSKPSTKETQQSYLFETAASPMGCVRQWQWCNPSLPHDQACGPLASYLDSYFGAAPLFGITDKEMERFLDSQQETSQSPAGSALIWGHIISNHNPFWLYQFLGMARSQFLSSEELIYGALAQGVSDDQWKQDVARWWETILATQQLSYINTVRGPSEPEFDDMRWPLANDYERSFCESQKILSTAHTSFSMFGLCFTFATGALIVLISYLLDPIFGFLHTRFRHKSYQHLEWRSNSTLQIHRQAEEQIGPSTWTKCTSRIPVSKADDVLSTLDIADPNHPKLRRPTCTGPRLPLDDLYEGSEEQQKVDSTSSGTEVANADNDVSTSDAPVDLELGLLDHPGDGTDMSDSRSEVSVLTNPYQAGQSIGAPTNPAEMSEVHPERASTQR